MNVFQAPDVKQHIAEKNLKNFGVKSFLQTDKARQANKRYREQHKNEIRSKTIITNIKRYGVPSFMQTDAGKAMAKQNMAKTREIGLQKLANLGLSNYFQVPDVKQSIIQTNINRYGVSYPAQNREIWKKAVMSAKMSSLEKRFHEFYE